MNLLQLAGSLPRDPQFREWLSIRFGAPQAPSEHDAVLTVRRICCVDSRRQLADDREAQQRFHDHIRRPFVAWRDQQQNHRRAA